MPIACDNTGNEKIMVRNLQLLMKPFFFFYQSYTNPGSNVLRGGLLSLSAAQTSLWVVPHLVPG